MKKYLLLILLTCSLFSATYRIGTFNTSEVGFPILDNSVITSTRSDGELTVLKKAPTTFKNEELLMRVRFGLKNYTLYGGKINSETYNQLSAFRLPASITYSEAMVLKYYDSQDKMEAQDLAKVYFDGSLIYTENNAKLYFFRNDKWITLEKIEELPGRLEILSNPSGASVTIDGIRKGKTPLSFVMDAPTVEVSLSKQGYYTSSFTASVASGQMKTQDLVLKRKVTITSKSNPGLLIDTTIRDIDDAEERLEAILSALKTAKSSEAKYLANFETSYPAIRPRGEFEERHDYERFKRDYDRKKSAERDKLMVDGNGFNSAIRTMKSHIDQLDKISYSLYLPINSMKLERYNIDKHEFPLTIDIKQGAFEFTFKGSLPIPTQAAKEFKFSSKEKGLRVKYWKRTVPVTVAGKKEKRYFKYGELTIPFKGREYRLAGEITLPKTIGNQKIVEDYSKGISAVLTNTTKTVDNSSYTIGGNDNFAVACSLYFQGIHDTVYIQKVIKQGHPLANAVLATKLNFGAGYPIDKSRAATLMKSVNFNTATKNKWSRLLEAYSMAYNYHPNTNSTRSRTLTATLAREGVPQAMALYGFKLIKGYGGSTDSTAAKEWFRKGADKGSLLAMEWLAYIAHNKRNYSTAYSWYKKAADADRVNCIEWIGYYYRNGYHVKKNNYEAYKWYMIAASRGDKNAQDVIGEFYEDGIGVAKNNYSAFKWYKKAAVNGIAHAQERVGYFYRKGLGITKNYKEAMKWFKKAADQGDADAMQGIGYLYQWGYGVTKSESTATTWYRKGANKGNATCMNQIGYFYQNGMGGLTKNHKTAVDWYKKGSNAGNKTAMSNLGYMYYKGWGVTRNYYDAFKWNKKSADKGSKLAMDWIGFFYQKGYGVTQNYYTAMTWYKKSADLGQASAMYNIGYLYEFGYGVSKSWYEAEKWYRKAAKAGNSSAKTKLKNKGISI